MSPYQLGRLVASAAVLTTLATVPVVTFPAVAHAAPQCGDGVDNDLDGKTDYPADPGCASAADNSENVPCTVTAGVTTCVGISASQVVQRVHVYRYDVVPGRTHGVAGFVDLYRFTLQTGTVVNLPCVVVVVDGGTTNPCGTADGTFVSRVATLVNQSVAEPTVVQGAELVSAGLCEGELVVTANNIGIASAEAYTLC